MKKLMSEEELNELAYLDAKRDILLGAESQEDYDDLMTILCLLEAEDLAMPDINWEDVNWTPADEEVPW